MNVNSSKITIDAVTKVFQRANGDDVFAVNDISFDVKQGEIFGLLGQNGAGKTTTLRMISTILKPTTGKISVDGFDTVSQSDDVRRQLGFLSGNTGLYKRLKAWEMVAYFGRLYGMDEKVLQERIDELFRLLDMNEFRDVQCGSLSTGTKQKVSIARTIVHDPPILVFDEPTVGLDPIIEHTLLDFIRDLRQRGKTIIFSTHIMLEAERLCDRIGIIHQGKLLEIGTLSEILSRTGMKTLEDAFIHLAKVGK